MNVRMHGMKIVTLYSIQTEMKKILIIEDEADMCLLLNIILTGRGIQLDHVKNISSAVSYLKTDSPSIVILDNKLPDGFGIDFIPEMKKNNPNIKIIMISGFNGTAKDLAIENGADIFLDKPFTKDQLFRSIKDLLN
jgi:two-component system OmpR family response regulator